MGEVCPVHTIKAYRRHRSINPLILNFNTRWRWVINFTPTTLPLEKKPCAHWIGGSGGPRSGQYILEMGKISCPFQDKNLDHPGIIMAIAWKIWGKPQQCYKLVKWITTQKTLKSIFNSKCVAAGCHVWASIIVLCPACTILYIHISHLYDMSSVQVTEYAEWIKE